MQASRYLTSGRCPASGMRTPGSCPSSRVGNHRYSLTPASTIQPGTQIRARVALLCCSSVAISALARSACGPCDAQSVHSTIQSAKDEEELQYNISAMASGCGVDQLPAASSITRRGNFLLPCPLAACLLRGMAALLLSAHCFRSCCGLSTSGCECGGSASLSLDGIEGAGLRRDIVRGQAVLGVIRMPTRMLVVLSK